MRATLLTALSCLALTGYGQQIRGKSIPSYTTKLGTVLHKGDTLTFGPGKRDNGTYKYADIPPNILVTAGMPLPASYVNKKVIIQDIKQESSTNGLNKQVSIAFKAGVFNARMDADAAEECGELVTKTNLRGATPAGASVADELLKLKGLLDSHVITQAEFDSQKAKLLNR